MALTMLQGKNAVVTGGAMGIGFALAEELLSRGASVCLADIDERALGTATAELAARLQPGQRVLMQITDVAQPQSVAALAEFAWRELGTVDLLCANAGVTTAYGGAPDEMPLADWHRQFDVNVFGVVHCLQAFLPRMRTKASPSHVLITASSAGLLPTANRAAYCASKHAVVGIGESLYLQLKGTPIGVTLLCPGVTATRMLEPDRNRPDGMPGRPLNPALLAHAKRAEEVARLAVAAVVSGAFWVLTHDDLKPAVLARAAAMASAASPPDSYH
jgi:NAD(P)-dependent dehydrogenase (short-subunit alcohol dehydrogenase family)